MFWKLFVLALVLWGLGMYFSVTLGGLIHLVPIAAVVFAVARRMARPPDSEFGRWRPFAERARRR